MRAFSGAIRAIDSHPATWRLFLFPPEGAPPVLYQRLARSQEAVRGFLEQELVEAFPDRPDPESSARIVHAAGRGLLQLRLADPEHATIERLVALVRHLRANVLAAGKPAD